jgi:hypothetical protein
MSTPYVDSTLAYSFAFALKRINAAVPVLTAAVAAVVVGMMMLEG